MEARNGANSAISDFGEASGISQQSVALLPDGSHGHPEPGATIDDTMIKAIAIARAFRWQKLLGNGT